MVRVDGLLLDMPDAVRGFTRYTSEQRANMVASHRLGPRQRERIGEAWWTHAFCPGVCFPTRKEALCAALAARAETLCWGLQ